MNDLERKQPRRTEDERGLSINGNEATIGNSKITDPSDRGRVIDFGESGESAEL